MVLPCRVLFHCEVSCHGTSVKVSIKCVVCYNNPIHMLLFTDNSDSPSIVEQLSQGTSLVYNTFNGDSLPALDLSYALCLVPNFLQHG